MHFTRHLQSALAMLALVLSLGASAQANGTCDKVAAAASAAACCTQLTERPSAAMVDANTAVLLLWLCGGLVVLGCGTVLWVVMNAKGDTRARRWRLTDALSEDVTYMDAAGHSVTLLTASSSRLIAILGLIVILSLYIAMGMLTLRAFALGGAVPSVVDTMLKFLVGGAGLFVPYLANQVRAGLEKKATTLATTTGGTAPIAVPVLPSVPSGPKVD